MKLSTILQEFFSKYLVGVKGVGKNTVDAYRDAFTIFLPFASQYYHIKINSLNIEHLTFDLILAFLEHLEKKRNNKTITRNQRLAALKSMAKMIRLMYPENRGIAEKILSIPQKRTQKTLIRYLSPEDILKVFKAVNLKKTNGIRDYTILHLLVDSGARASEIATLNIDFFDSKRKTLAILGKADRYRQIELNSKTCELIQLYMEKYRPSPKPLYKNRIFINQRKEEFTRHGIYSLCKKYLEQALPDKRLIGVNPVHSFRHSCAVTMLCSGKDITEIKNRLGHENIKNTMKYLQLELSKKREIQKKFIEYTQSKIDMDPKMDDLLDWENKQDILSWLDSL